MIDTRLVPDEQEEITAGEAVARMIPNGMGWAHWPLSLPPKFFTNTSEDRDLLGRREIRAETGNHFQRGRTLDEVRAYGGDLLRSEWALAVCVQEGMGQRFHHRDTTSFALRGDDIPESDM